MLLGDLGGDRFAAAELGEGFNGFAGFLFGEAKVVESLEIEPKLGAGAKKVGETEGGVAGNGAGAIENLRDAIGGHGDFARQLRGAEVEGFQFFGEVFAWMNSLNGHSGAPSDNRQSRRSTDLVTWRATRNTNAIGR